MVALRSAWRCLSNHARMLDLQKIKAREALVEHPHYPHCYLPFAKHQASRRDLLFWCGAFFGDEGREFARHIPALTLH